MKIIYVPITVPWNVRSIVAMCITLVCVIICAATPFSTDWYHAEYKLEIIEATDLNRVVLEIGPWELKMQLCGMSASIGSQVCHDKFSVFQECRRPQGQSLDLTRFGSQQEGEFRSFSWCSGWKLTVTGFGMMLVAALLGLINLGATLINERCSGPFSLVSLMCLVAGLILIGEGVSSFMDNEIPKLEDYMRGTGLRSVTVSRRPGAALVFAALAAVAWTVSTLLSFTLLCCPPKNFEKRQLPRIVVVSTDRSALGGPMPTIPGTPGFHAVGADHPHHSHVDEVDYGGDEEMTGRSGAGVPSTTIGHESPSSRVQGDRRPRTEIDSTANRQFSTTGRDRRSYETGGDDVVY